GGGDKLLYRTLGAMADRYGPAFNIRLETRRAFVSKSTAKEAPEPGGGWPIIGHLHLLGGGDKLLYRTLGAMADRYGPAFNIRLGTRRAFVVSSWEVAKECFTINDKALASRPKTAAVKHMGYNYAVFGFAPYTPFWREMRKIATLELLSNRRLEMLKDVRSSEINSGGGDEAERCQKGISDFFRLIGIFVVSDAIPFLWWSDLQGRRSCPGATFGLQVLHLTLAHLVHSFNLGAPGGRLYQISTATNIINRHRNDCSPLHHHNKHQRHPSLAAVTIAAATTTLQLLSNPQAKADKSPNNSNPHHNLNP
nr:cytochrome P450 82C4-like [Tanacetum cinerariifolium]